MIAGIGAVSLPAGLSGITSSAQSAATTALREASATATAHAGSVGSIGNVSSGEGALGSSETGTQGLSGTEGLGGAEGIGAGESIGGGGAAGTGSGGFGEALTSAIGSLEKTQNDASAASQALATGTVSDPESAVVTVEEAQLAMQLASQIRTKATEAVSQIFQTQV